MVKLKKTIILLLMFVFLVGIVSAETTYTSSTERTCENGQCNIVLYSGTKFVFQDNDWVDIREARSLMGIYTIRYLKNDGIHDIELLELNYTSVKFGVRIKDLKESEKDIPFKIDDVQVETRKLRTLDQQGLINHKSANVLASNYTFGSRSTTISLQDADTENVGDAPVFVSTLDTNYDTLTELWIVDIVNHRKFYVKWTIVSIPDNVVIDEAKVQLRATRVDQTRAVAVHHVYSNTSIAERIEDTLTYRNQPCGQVLTNNSACNITFNDIVSVDTIDTFYIWNVTPSLRRSYNDGFDNYSLHFLSNESAAGDAMHFASKEHATATFRPQLNITYSSPPSVDNNRSAGVNVSINGTFGDIIGENFTFAAFFLSNITGSEVFTRNGTVIINNSDQNLNAGYYNFTCFIPTNDSVIGASISRFATMLDLDPQDNNISTSVTVLMNFSNLIPGFHRNLTIFLSEAVNVSYLEINGTAVLTRDGSVISNNSFHNLTLGIFNFTAVITSNNSVKESRSSLFLTVVDDPDPTGFEFRIGQCRLDNTPTVLIQLLFFFLALSIIVIGKTFKIGIVGAFGSLMLVFLSFYLYFCILLPAIFLTAAGVMLMFYFVLRGLEGKL